MEEGTVVVINVNLQTRFRVCEDTGLNDKRRRLKSVVEEGLKQMVLVRTVRTEMVVCSRGIIH